MLATRRPRAPGDPTPWVVHVMAVEEGQVGPLEHETSRARFVGRGRTLEAPLAMEQQRPALGDHGHGARPRPLPPARARDPRRREGAGRLHDRARRDARGRARARREVPRRARERPHLRARLDRRPRRAQAPRHLGGPGAALPAAGLGDRLPQLGAPGRARGHRAERARQGGPLALRDLGRPAHPAGPPRRHRVRRPPARGAPRARVLAPQRPHGRSRSSSTRSRAATSSRSRSRRSRSSARARPRRRSTSPAACSCAAPIRCRRPIRCCSRPPPAPCCCPRRARSRASSGAPSRGSRRSRRPSSHAAKRRPEAAGANRQAGAPLLERARRLPPRRARVRDRPRRPGTGTPLPWCNVVANPRFGFVVSESGASFTWTDNSQTHRLTPVVQRSDLGSLGRGHLPPRRRGRLDLVADAAAGGRGRRVPRAPRPGLHHLRAPPRDPRPRAHGLRGRGRQREDLGASGLKNGGERARRLSVFGYVEWVLGDDPGGDRALGGDGARRRHRRGAREEPLVVVPRAVRVLRRERGLPQRDRRPAGVPRAQRLAPEARGASRGPRSPAASAPGSIPARRIQLDVTLAPGETQDVVFVLGEGDGREQALSLARTYRDPARVQPTLDAVTRRWDEILGAVQVVDAGPGVRLAPEPLAALPGGELPPLGAVGLLPIGRRVRLPRSAPGRPRHRSRRARARPRAHPPGRGAPVPRGRRAALVAPGERPGRAHPLRRTTSCGCPTSWPATSRPPATAPSSTSSSRSSTRACSSRRSTRCSACPRRRATRPRSTSTARAPSIAARPRAPTGCR